MFSDLWTNWRRREQWLAGLVAVAVVLLAGCDTEEKARLFRDAAAAQLEQGLQTFASGLITGAFAAAVPSSVEGEGSSGGDTIETAQPVE